MDLTTIAKRSSAVIASWPPAACSRWRPRQRSMRPATTAYATRTATACRTAGSCATTSTRTTPTPRADPDRDGLHNLGEFRHGTAPHDSDSDGDGMGDGDEVEDGCMSTDPTDADTDGDGVEDGQEDADDDGIDNAEDEHRGRLRRGRGPRRRRGRRQPHSVVASYVVR